MPWEHIGMCAKCQGNAWEWVQNARGMQGNDRIYQVNVWELVQSARECRGIPGKCNRGCAKCLENAGECQGNVWKWV